MNLWISWLLVTQHIPDKGEHQIRYNGWYSNMNLGLRKNTETVTAPTPNIADQDWEKLEPESAYVKKMPVEVGSSFQGCL